MGRKTSFYLSNTQLLRLQALGDPSLAEVMEAGIRSMEIGSSTLDGHDRDPSECGHPMARRDQKSGLCNACGVNVG